MAEVFSTVPVRTDVDGDVVVGIASGQTVGISGTVAITSGATLDVEVVQPLPTGTNTIGNVGITGSLPAGANTIGAVTISGTPTVTVSGTVDVNVTNASINVAVTSALPAGTNTIGKVEIVNTTGTVVQEVVATVTDIAKNGGTATLNSTAIPNGDKGELRQIIVTAGVAMKAVIRKDNTVTPVNAAVAYIPAGGGTINLPFLDEAVVLNGTAAGENFDVVFTNLDRTNDAPASVTFVYSLEP